MTTSTCIDPQIGCLLARYELGQLNDHEQIEFEQHLMDCKFCFEEIVAARATIEALEANRMQIAGILREQGLTFDTLYDSIQAESKRAASPRLAKRLNTVLAWWRKPIAWGGSALAAGLALLFLMLNPSRHPDTFDLDFHALPFEGTMTRSLQSPTEQSYAQAVSAYEAGDYEKSAVLFKHVIESDTSNGEAYLYLGVSRYLMRESDATASLETAVTKLSDRLRDHAEWYLAQSHVLNGRRDLSDDLLLSISGGTSVHSSAARELLTKLRK